MISMATPKQGDLLSKLEGHEIGIAELDAQHGQLFDFLAELKALRGKRYSFSAATNLLGRLAEFAKLHFAIEESMMRLLGYPDIEAHVEAHRQLSKQILSFRSHLINEDLAAQLQGFIEKWLIEHIDNVDRKLVNHFLQAHVLQS